MRVIHGSIVDTDITWWLSDVLYALIVHVEREENQSNRRKALEAKRDQLPELSHTKRHTPGLVSEVRSTTRQPRAWAKCPSIPAVVRNSACLVWI